MSRDLENNPDDILEELEDRIKLFYSGPDQPEPVFPNTLEGDLLQMFYRARCLQKEKL